MKDYETMYKGKGSNFTDKPEKGGKLHKHLLSGKRRSQLYKLGGC